MSGVDLEKIPNLDHSGLKGEIPEKNVSDNPSMNSSTKICIDSEKLRPKIREWDLFELTLQNDAKKTLKFEF